MQATLCGLVLAGCSDRSSTPAGASILDWNGHARITLPLAVDASGNPVTSIRIMGGEAAAVVDSGAGLSALEPDLAAALGLDRHKPRKVNSRTYDTTAGVAVVLGAIHLDLHRVVVGDLPGDTRAVLGMDLFRNAAVEMDFDRGQLTLVHPDAFTPPDATAIPLRMMNGVPVLQARVNDGSRQVCAIVDTGFDGGLAMPRQLVDELGLPGYSNRLRSLEGLGGVRHVSAALVPLHQFRIGDHAYQDVPVVEWRSHGSAACNNLGNGGTFAPPPAVRHRGATDVAPPQEQRADALSRALKLPPPESPCRDSGCRSDPSPA